MITVENLSDIYENTDDEVLEKYVDAINKTIEDFGINNPAMFIAQIGVESQGLKHVEENLNYSAQRLAQVFPRYFRDRDPNDYGHQPEKIANLVYGGRMGNGNEDSGDGYKFHGRGAIQLTGKANYEAFAKAVEMDLDAAVEYTKTPEGAIMSAGWFWDANHINKISDDIHATSRRINGGDNGLKERIELYEKAKEVLG